MQPAKAISDVIKSLDLLLFGLYDEEEADWVPRQGEIVLFLAEDNVWRTGSYQSLWADIRGLRFEGDDRNTNFEPSPYEGDTTIRAKVNRAVKTENGWIIDYIFSYAAIADILPYDAVNIEYALLSNQAAENALVA